MKKKKKISKIKNQTYDIILFTHESSMNLILHVIGFIIILYGAWFHNPLWLLSGFIPMLVGHWWESIHKNGKKN